MQNDGVDKDNHKSHKINYVTGVMLEGENEKATDVQNGKESQEDHCEVGESAIDIEECEAEMGREDIVEEAMSRLIGYRSGASSK